MLQRTRRGRPRNAPAGFILPCRPTVADRPPTGPGWVQNETGRGAAWAQSVGLALLNLSLNARDAMPDGGDIILSAREERIAAANRPGLEAGQYIRISVIDTGEGMDSETLRKAAEPFFTTKGVGKGTGLGLSMVHGFAEQSGGHLILYSQKGSGTTAELWLPVAKTSAQPVAPAQVTPPKSFVRSQFWQWTTTPSSS